MKNIEFNENGYKMIDGCYEANIDFVNGIFEFSYDLERNEEEYKNIDNENK